MAKILNVSYSDDPQKALDLSLQIIDRDFKLGLITQDDKTVMEKFRIKLMSYTSPRHILSSISALLVSRRYFSCSFTDATDDDYENAMSQLSFAKSLLSCKNDLLSHQNVQIIVPNGSSQKKT